MNTKHLISRFIHLNFPFGSPFLYFSNSSRLLIPVFTTSLLLSISSLFILNPAPLTQIASAFFSHVFCLSHSSGRVSYLPFLNAILANEFSRETPNWVLGDLQLKGLSPKLGWMWLLAVLFFLSALPFALLWDLYHHPLVSFNLQSTIWTFNKEQKQLDGNSHTLWSNLQTYLHLSLLVSLSLLW